MQGSTAPAPRPQLSGYPTPSRSSTSYSSSPSTRIESSSFGRLTREEMMGLATFLNHPNPKVVNSAYEQILANVDDMDDLLQLTSHRELSIRY